MPSADGATHLLCWLEKAGSADIRAESVLRIRKSEKQAGTGVSWLQKRRPHSHFRAEVVASPETVVNRTLNDFFSSATASASTPKLPSEE